MTTTKYSASPSGEKCQPLQTDYKAEFARLKKLAAANASRGARSLSWLESASSAP